MTLIYHPEKTCCDCRVRRLCCGAMWVPFGIGVIGVALLSSVSGLANAQEGAPIEEMPPPNDAPPARTGFQLGLRTGYSIPMGKLADGENSEMSEFTTGQVPLLIDIGGKVIPNLFVGGYLGLGFGGAAGNTADLCDAADASCVAISFRLGIEAIFSFLPDGAINPWIGYGIGREATGVGGSNDDDQESTVTYSGWEFARFMVGADFRINRTFGVGPFVDYSLGSYSTVSVTNDPGADADNDIDETAMHQWLTFGARFVFFP